MDVTLTVKKAVALQRPLLISQVHPYNATASLRRQWFDQQLGEMP